MKIFTVILGSILVVLSMTNTSFASDDFQIKPPALVSEMIGTNNKRLKLNLLGIDTANEQYIQSLILYFSVGIHTETNWFDRRLNWSSYSTEAILDTKMLAIRFQGNSSSTRSDNFELFDTRIDVYAYTGTADKESRLFRIGGGLSYFDCDSYKGQEFLDDQRFAAFANVVYNDVFIFTEIKLVMLIHDNFYNGGLFELKFFSPLADLGKYVGAELSPLIYTAWTLVLSVVYSEIGITGSFGLPGGNDGWGWFIKGRCIIPYMIFLQNFNEYKSERFLRAEQFEVYPRIELYWRYKDGIDNDFVAKGWEFGIKFTLLGF
ncbi:MAG: hypothetical protein K8S87_07945 [Planctomycetes bacterium]|nr:hypothetical protein [Planctomycetota bacterium]